jgi:GNAT superfamily N-acetyltransferase
MPVVRDAVPADAERIGEAHAEAWRLAYEGLFSADVLAAAVHVRRRMWVGLVGDPALGGKLLVAEEARGVVGFIHFGPASENDEVGELYGFYVHPSSWGTGDAQALIDAAVSSLAQTFDRAILWTHVDAGNKWQETGLSHARGRFDQQPPLTMNQRRSIPWKVGEALLKALRRDSDVGGLR